MPDEPVEATESASTSNISAGVTLKEERKEIAVSIVKTSSSKLLPISPPPSLTSNLKDIDDDDKIELILLDVQTEQSRVQQVLSKLQDYGKDLLELK